MQTSRGMAVTLAIALATVATPAHAHALGIGVFVFVVLLLGWPALCISLAVTAPPGERMSALGAALFGYPLTYFAIEWVMKFLMRNSPPSREDDAQWFVLFVQPGIWAAIVYFIVRSWRDSD